MKIFVLHGEDLGKSYSRLKKFIDTAKKRSWEVTYLDETNNRLQDELSAASLFGGERFFIIRDVKKIGKPELKWLTDKAPNLDGNLVIYHEGDLPLSFIKALPKDVKIEAFILPKLIWNFLDGLYPGNASKSLVIFHRIIETDPPEMVFSLIAKLFRDLFWVMEDVSTLPYPTWRASKLKSQASKFSKEKLIKVINLMSEIDVKVKKGKADLVSSLDLLMVKHLE